MPLWLRLLARFLLTIVLVWAMNKYLHTWIVVTGGVKAYIIIAALVTLMNIVVTPVLDILVTPLAFFATFLAVIIVNGVFLWLTLKIVGRMEPSLVTMTIKGGIPGWIVAIIALGIAKWLMKTLLR